MGEGQRERKREDPKQAPHCQHTAHTWHTLGIMFVRFGLMGVQSFVKEVSYSGLVLSVYDKNILVALKKCIW